MPHRKNKPREPASTRVWTLAASALIHLGVLAFLLFRHQPAVQPVIAEHESTISLLQLQSAERLTAQTLAPVTPPTPPKPRRPKKVAPKAPKQPPKQIVTTADVPPRPIAPTVTPPAPTASTTPASSAAAAPVISQVAAAPPPEAEFDTPPPIEYLRRVAHLISIKQKCPWNAQFQRGAALVRMHLSRNGQVMRVNMIRSSGHSALDAEAVAVMRRIAQFPPFPYDYLPRIGEFDIDQPVTCGRM